MKDNNKIAKIVVGISILLALGFLFMFNRDGTHCCTFKFVDTCDTTVVLVTTGRCSEGGSSADLSLWYGYDTLLTDTVPSDCCQEF